MAKKGQAQEKKPQIPSKQRRRVKHAPSKEEKLETAIAKFQRRVAANVGDRRKREGEIMRAVKAGQLEPLSGPEFQAAVTRPPRWSPPVAAVKSLLE